MISIHAAREGGDTPERQRFTIAHISIHAAREGGDANAVERLQRARISIHAAREGGDARARTMRSSSFGFQSTPPVKAATHSLHRIPGQHRFQSTPPVKAATVLAAAFNMDKAISIHAAREGGDR